MSIVKQKFDETLQLYGPVAILDFPNHNNVGDSAIWLGEYKYLNSAKADIRYVASISAFSLNVLKKAMPNGTILLHGGGNFGTLWPHHQQLREKILAECRNYKVIQLPQTVYFEDTAAFERCADLVKKHPDFTLMVRDSNSLMLGERLGAKCCLSPDAAHFLRGVLHRGKPVVSVFGLIRNDKESIGKWNIEIDHKYKYEIADWKEDDENLFLKLISVLERRSHGRFGHLRMFQRTLMWLYNRAALRRLLKGVNQLSRGKVVLTDRLHAHILSSMLKIPNIVLDNHYGKVHGYIKEWGGSDNTRVVASIQEIGRAVKDILE